MPVSTASLPAFPRGLTYRPIAIASLGGLGVPFDKLRAAWWFNFGFTVFE
jgi:hypothetical protein